MRRRLLRLLAVQVPRAALRGRCAGRPDLLEQLHPDKLLAATEDIPERFELGTLPYELLAGTTAAVDFLSTLAGPAGTPETPVNSGLTVTAGTAGLTGPGRPLPDASCWPCRWANSKPTKRASVPVSRPDCRTSTGWCCTDGPAGEPRPSCFRSLGSRRARCRPVWPRWGKRAGGELLCHRSVTAPRARRRRGRPRRHRSLHRPERR